MMGFFRKDTKDINRVGGILRDRILQIDHIIKERNKDKLCSFLKEIDIKYTEETVSLNPHIIWFYPEIDDFTFSMNNDDFTINGEEEYFGLFVFGGNAGKYSVSIMEKSVSGRTATKSAKTLQSILAGYPEFFNLDDFIKR